VGKLSLKAPKSALGIDRGVVVHVRQGREVIRWPLGRKLNKKDLIKRRKSYIKNSVDAKRALIGAIESKSA
jgi:hypothetical protein